MKVTGNKEQNLQNARDMIIRASSDGAGIIILPEMFNSPYQAKYFKIFAETYPGKTTEMLSSLAQKLNVYIVGGSIPEKEGDKIFNTSFSFGKNGELIGKHRKIHLFDIDIKNKISYRESDYIAPGDKITILDTEYCKIGIAICYDMRFPELIRKMTLEGARIIIIPAAFNMITGPAHWHIIARARAIDNQVFFITASPARDENADYIAYGHSLVCDPWGEIIAESDEKENILYGILDLDMIPRIRKQLPLLLHRREEIYRP